MVPDARKQVYRISPKQIINFAEELLIQKSEIFDNCKNSESMQNSIRSQIYFELAADPRSTLT
jgi:hypothetical protein